MDREHSRSSASPWRWRGLACVVGLASLTLAWQGWRGAVTGLEYDNVVNIDEAAALLAKGELPQEGAIASLGGYNPPGSAWLMTPGVATGTPRLFELTGASILHVLTLIGLWMLVRAVRDEKAALLVITLYAFSALGLFFAESLWPRAKPCAFVWMTYFALLWSRRRNSWWLAASLIVYALGLLVFLEMLPALFGLVALWWRGRLPVRIAPLLAAGIVSAAVWTPYLAMDSRTGFQNLRVQLLRSREGRPRSERLAPFADRLQQWNSETGSLEPYDVISADASDDGARSTKKLFFRVYYALRNLFANFTHMSPGGALAALVFFMPFAAYASRALAMPTALARHVWLKWLGVVFLLGALGANHWLAGAVFGRQLDWSESAKIWLVQASLAVVGIALVFRGATARFLSRLEAWMFELGASEDQTASTLDVITCLAAPWLVVAAVAEYPRYGWWLWGVQVVILGVATLQIPAAGRWPRSLYVGLVVAVLASVGANDTTLGKLQDWRLHGFAGQNTDLVNAVDVIAADAVKRNLDRPAIGYLLFFNGYECVEHEKDARYKIGAPLDQYLLYEFAIENDTSNAEGHGPNDDYRLVETTPRPGKMRRFRFADQPEFEFLEVHGPYEVWRRRSS